jgi:exonuclease SbcD
MKILQLSDLHLGKRLKEYSLIEDQRYVLNQAVDLIDKERLDAMLLCGDIYDSTVPSAEATALFDEFLTAVHQKRLPIFIISGNHDSADKLHFGSAIFKDEGIHVITRVQDALSPMDFKGIEIYCLPFIRPADVNYAFGTDAKSYSDAIKEVLTRMGIDKTKTNLLLAHQTVLPDKGPLLLGGSEEVLGDEDGAAVGDVSAVPSSLFKDFDYVALGHIHKAQAVARNARYAGSILKYHKDEANNPKSFTLLEVSPKSVVVTPIPIHPLHDVVHVSGSLEEILGMDADKSAYLFASLTDKTLLDDPMAKLKIKYPYAAWVDYVAKEIATPELPTIDVEHVSKEKLFSDFYLSQNQEPLSETQLGIVRSLLSDSEDKKAL